MSEECKNFRIKDWWDYDRPTGQKLGLRTLKKGEKLRQSWMPGKIKTIAEKGK